MAMRWGDSDSSEDDEPPISASSLTRMHQERQESGDFTAPKIRAPPSNKNQSSLQQNAASSSSMPRPDNNQRNFRSQSEGNHGRGRGGGSHNHGGNNHNSHHNQQQHGNMERSKSGGGGGRGRGGNSGGGQDWKSMAKASSKFGQQSQPANLDGGNWMAQRKAKMQAHEQESKAEQEKKKEEEAQEKRQRRKSQMQALKVRAYVQEEEVEFRNSFARSSICSFFPAILAHTHSRLIRSPFRTLF